MSSICGYVKIVLICLSLAACAGPYLRPDVDRSLMELGYHQDVLGKPGLRLTFFGTSTLLLSDGETSIMTDGFFSRPSWGQLAFASLESDTKEIDFALHKARISKLDAIFVAHSHHDHAMDSGLVAKKTGAILYGSGSTLNIARGQQTPEQQLCELTPGEQRKVGKFQVRILETPHSPEPIYPGFIDHPLLPPGRLSDYRMGETFSFFVEHPLGNVLIVPGANYEPHAFDGLHADVVILSIGTLGKQSYHFTRDYWEEVVRKTGARLVIPVHWDDFTKSLREPLVPLPYFADNMTKTMKRLLALANRDGVAIRFLPAFRTISLPVREPWSGSPGKVLNDSLPVGPCL